MADDTPLLELCDLSKSYAMPTGPVSVLAGVNLCLQAGQSLAVVGASGSGKSTLLNLIGAMDAPSGGQVRLAGRNLAGMSAGELAQVRNRLVGFVFQWHHLLGQCSALENVLIPTLAHGRPDKDAPARAMELLGRVGLADRSDHRPGQLSGGQCQRVAVARALINRPRLLLADEPTGSLDRDSREGLIDLLVELGRQEKLAMIVVTHSMDLARRMGRVMRLSGGVLVEGGDE